MKREQVSYRRGAIQAALDMIPKRLHALAACDLFIGVDPVFAGVHQATKTHDGRSYKNLACCCYEWHTPDKRTTVCLPTDDEPWVVIHEFGHVIDAATNFAYAATPCTRYAQTNSCEAFAEAFTAWIAPEPYLRAGIRPARQDADFFAGLRA